MAYRVPGSIGIALICAAVLSACEQPPGVSGRDAELQRAKIASQPFHVVSASHQRAVVSARGRQVAIEAADGFCVAEESVETSGRSAFALIGDCLLDDPAVRKGSVPKGVPGIITVSISGDRGYSNSGNGAGTLSDLSKFLNTKEGRKMLGRGGSGGSVKIHDSRKIDGGLYVLVEDQDRAVVPILASRFWRSFIDLNDRLTVVTISGFRDKPMAQDEMLKHLVAQVKTLASANREPINEPITVIAKAEPDEPSRAIEGTVQTLSDLEPEGVTITAENDAEDSQFPLPQVRPSVEIAQAASEPKEDEPPQEFEAPSEVDPALRTEIAAVSGAVPLPTPAPGRPEQARDTEEAVVASVATDAEPAAENSPTARNSGAGSDVASSTTEPEPTVAESAATPETKPAADPASSDTPSAQAPKTAPKAPKRPRRS